MKEERKKFSFSQEQKEKRREEKRREEKRREKREERREKREERREKREERSGRTSISDDGRESKTCLAPNFLTPINDKVRECY